MSVLNPDPQKVQEPSFLNYFRPTSAPEPNVKTGMALEAVGKIGEGLLKTSDQLVDKMATDEATKKAEELQQQKITEQGNTLRLLQLGESRGEGEPVNIQSVAQQAATNASNLTSSRANGKMSQTQYLSELHTMQYDLHAQYPQHYHGIIDRAVSKVTGFNVAEDLVKSQQADINSYIGRKDADHEKLATKLNASLMFGNNEDPTGLPNNPQWTGLINKWHAGGPDAPSDDVMRSLLGRFEAQDYQTKKESNEIELANKQGQNVKERATTALSTTMLHQSVDQQLLMDAHTNADVEAGRQWFKDVLSGKQQPNDELGIHYAQVFRAAKQQVSDNLDAVIKADKNYKLADPVKLKADKDAILSVWDGMAQAFEDKEHGLAYFAYQLNKAGAEDAYRRLTTDTRVPIALRNSFIAAKAIGKDAPQQFTNVLASIMTTSKQATDFFTSPLAADIFQSYLPKPIGDAPTPPTPTPGPIRTDDIKPSDTPGGLADKYKAAGAPPEIQKHVVDMVPSAILSKDLSDGHKKEVLRRAFNPANFDMLTKYEEDHRDPKGNQVPGQYAVLQHWGSPEMATEVRRISKTDPHVWNMYQSWMHTEFFNLFDRDFNSLGDFNKFPGRKVIWNTDNIDNPHFELTKSEGKFNQRFTSPEEASAEQKIENLNKGFQVIRNMQKAHGDTPEKINEYMIQTMRNAGYDYNKIVVDNIDNIPADMVKAVLANSKPPEPTTATKKPAPRKKKSEAR